MYVDTNGNIDVNTQTPHQMFHVVDGNILLSHSSTRAPGSYNGSILFGTKNPQAKLAVNGGILAKSVRVNTGSTYWPDYVFRGRL